MGTSGPLSEENFDTAFKSALLSVETLFNLIRSPITTILILHNVSNSSKLSSGYNGHSAGAGGCLLSYEVEKND